LSVRSNAEEEASVLEAASLRLAALLFGGYRAAAGFQRGAMRIDGFIAVPVAVVFGCGLARADEFVIEQTFLRTTIQERPVRLEALVVKREAATERLPVAIITHGKPAALGDMLDGKSTDLAGPARDLAKRGWLAVVVMRRGFGQSDGPMPAPVSCVSKSLVERLNADADDLQAAIDAISKRPDADPDRVIAIGGSAGGAAVVALAARNPKNLRGVVSVSGGLRLLGCPKENELVQAYSEFGAVSRVPNIWLYAKNDSFFGPDLVTRMQSAFLGGGGDVKLVQFEKIGEDGHGLFMASAGRLRWLMEVDSFLRFHKLPATFRGEQVSDLMKLLKFERNQRGFLETYLAAPTYKAMAQSPEGKVWIQYGAGSSASVRKSAVDGCTARFKSGEPCKLVMESDSWIATEEGGSGGLQ
jgi:dienelactone hydrolase